MKKIITLIGLLWFSGVAWAQSDQPTRILAFGDSNTWGWKAVASAGFPTQRFSDNERWGGVLEQALGEGYQVTVNGLVGRTTDLDGGNIGEIRGASFNGARALPMAIARHNPLELVVIMLGTNDLQSGREKTPQEVARSAFSLGRIARKMKHALFSSYDAPAVLVIAPPPMGDTSGTPLKGLFQAGEQPSKHLGAAFTAESLRSENRDIWFLDAGKVISTDGADGIHLSKQNHQQLGRAVAKLAQQILAKK